MYTALYYKPFISKALRYGPYVTTGSHSFTCHPHTNHICLYSPATRRHCPILTKVSNTRSLKYQGHIRDFNVCGAWGGAWGRVSPSYW